DIRAGLPGGRRRIVFEPLLAPFQGVAVHVEQAELVWREAADGQHPISRVSGVTRVAIEILGSFAEVPAGLRLRAAGVFPFCSARQAVAAPREIVGDRT